MASTWRRWLGTILRQRWDDDVPCLPAEQDVVGPVVGCGQRGAETLVTELVLTQTVDACDRHRQGWSRSFDCLYEYLSEKGA